jgi:N-hydroxyarylamine O-acetyltransferase
VKLDPESLQQKLVKGGRGGWCFEQNLLLSYMLVELGFDVTRLAARVRWNVAAHVVTARSHMLLLVKLGRHAYIADVGFGGLTLTTPLRLETGIEQATRHEPHRLMRLGDGFALEAKVAGEWQPLYTFELQEQQLPDYEVSNWYLANHPQSQFVTGVIAARAAPDRRHALRNTRYVIHHAGGGTEKRFLTSVADYKELLAGPLRIRLPEAPGLDAKLAQLIASNPSP